MLKLSSTVKLSETSVNTPEGREGMTAHPADVSQCLSRFNYELNIAQPSTTHTQRRLGSPWFTKIAKEVRIVLDPNFQTESFELLIYRVAGSGHISSMVSC